MKQSYNEHIRALAYKFRAEVTPDRQSVSAGEIMRASIAVAEMAEEVRDAFRRVRHWVSVTDEWIEIYLKEQGLIPDDGQETKYWKDYWYSLTSQGIVPKDGQEAGSDGKE